MIDGFYLAGLELKCDGQYIVSRPSRFCNEFGNWLPGECAHIENFKVFVGKIEITNELTKRQLSELETDYLIYHEGSEESA